MKYSGLTSSGSILDFVAKSDKEAINKAKTENFQSLLKVKNYTQNGIISTLLQWKEEGYSNET